MPKTRFIAIFPPSRGESLNFMSHHQDVWPEFSIFPSWFTSTRDIQQDDALLSGPLGTRTPPPVAPDI